MTGARLARARDRQAEDDLVAQPAAGVRAPGVAGGWAERGLETDERRIEETAAPSGADPDRPEEKEDEGAGSEEDEEGRIDPPEEREVLGLAGEALAPPAGELSALGCEVEAHPARFYVPT
ncbi:MAG TPA: hypothetical protein VGG06_29070 [Thermoanaerobaculia bacterium]